MDRFHHVLSRRSDELAKSEVTASTAQSPQAVPQAFPDAGFYKGQNKLSSG